MEKPTALDVEELDQILDACESNGLQFMDGTMWYHHPRTAKMKELASDPLLFGQLKWVIFVVYFIYYLQCIAKQSITDSLIIFKI
ncbi:unnamed protein product [Camellia sinensis]